MMSPPGRCHDGRPLQARPGCSTCGNMIPIDRRRLSARDFDRVLLCDRHPTARVFAACSDLTAQSSDVLRHCPLAIQDKPRPAWNSGPRWTYGGRVHPCGLHCSTLESRPAELLSIAPCVPRRLRVTFYTPSPAQHANQPSRPSASAFLPPSLSVADTDHGRCHHGGLSRSHRLVPVFNLPQYPDCKAGVPRLPPAPPASRFPLRNLVSAIPIPVVARESRRR